MYLCCSILIILFSVFVFYLLLYIEIVYKVNFTSSGTLKLPLLKMDQASLTIANGLDVNISAWYTTLECELCKPVYYDTIPANCNLTYTIMTNFLTNFLFTYMIDNAGLYKNETVNETFCSKSFKYNEHGVYTLYVSPFNSTDGSKCFIVPDNDGVDFLIPVYIQLSAIFLFFLMRAVIYHFIETEVWRHWFCKSKTDYSVQVDNDLGRSDSVNNIDRISSGSSLAIHSESSKASQAKRNRVNCIDTLRGLSLVIMIFVNYGGGGYWFFAHSAWNGLTVADLVFPWFVFVMGSAIGLNLRRSLRRGVSKQRMLVTVCKRTVILFAIGVFLSSENVPLQHLRIPGVLQRLALSYFFVAIVEILFADPRMPNTDCFPLLEEQTHLLGHWIIFIAFIVIHCMVTFLLPVPGCPQGYLGPGGLHKNGSFANCTGGAAGLIDRTIFGNHMYNRPTCKSTYLTTVSFDPEGILGTLTSAVICFFGFVAGRIIDHFHQREIRREKSVLNRFIIWGTLLGLTGGALCGFSQNDGAIPVNKNLWSLSFVMVLSCFAYFLLAMFYYLTDCGSKPLWSGRPFIYPGTNSLIIYVGHEVFHQYLPVTLNLPPSYEPSHAVQLAIHSWGTVFWILVAYFLHTKNMFFSI